MLRTFSQVFNEAVLMTFKCPDNSHGFSDCPNMVLVSDSLLGKIWIPWFIALFVQLPLFPSILLQQAWEQLRSMTPAICARASQILTLWFNNPPSYLFHSMTWSIFIRWTVNNTSMLFFSLFTILLFHHQLVWLSAIIPCHYFCCTFKGEINIE